MDVNEEWFIDAFIEAHLSVSPDSACDTIDSGALLSASNTEAFRITVAIIRTALIATTQQQGPHECRVASTSFSWLSMAASTSFSCDAAVWYDLRATKPSLRWLLFPSSLERNL